MDAVERGRRGGVRRTVAPGIAVVAGLPEPRPPLANRQGGRPRRVGEEHALQRIGAGPRLLLQPGGDGVRPPFAEELGGPLGHRQQADHALLRFDGALLPLLEVDAQRLRKAAHDVEDEGEAHGLAGGGALGVLRVLVGGRFVGGRVRVLCSGPAGGVGGRRLQRPEEERRQSRVLLQRAGEAVARLRLRRAKYALKRGAADDLPDLLQVLRQADRAPIGGLDGAVAAEDLQGGADAGEHEIGAADALALQALHPVGDALRQLAQHVGPVADGRVARPGAADEVNAGSERRRLSGVQPAAHLSRDGPRAGERPASADDAGEQRLPTFRRFVGEDYRSDAVIPHYTPSLGESLRHPLFVRRWVLVGRAQAMWPINDDLARLGCRAAVRLQRTIE